MTRLSRLAGLALLLLALPVGPRAQDESVNVYNWRDYTVESELVAFERDQAVLKAGQWFALVTPGAGGYGPPGERTPEAVARDLAEGVITPAVASHAYGHSGAPSGV